MDRSCLRRPVRDPGRSAPLARLAALPGRLRGRGVPARPMGRQRSSPRRPGGGDGQLRPAAAGRLVAAPSRPSTSPAASPTVARRSRRGCLSWCRGQHENCWPPEYCAAPARSRLSRHSTPVWALSTQAPCAASKPSLPTSPTGSSSADTTSCCSVPAGWHVGSTRPAVAGRAGPPPRRATGRGGPRREGAARAARPGRRHRLRPHAGREPHCGRAHCADRRHRPRPGRRGSANAPRRTRVEPAARSDQQPPAATGARTALDRDGAESATEDFALFLGRFHPEKGRTSPSRQPTKRVCGSSLPARATSRPRGSTSRGRSRRGCGTATRSSAWPTQRPSAIDCAARAACCSPCSGRSHSAWS